MKVLSDSFMEVIWVGFMEEVTSVLDFKECKTHVNGEEGPNFSQGIQNEQNHGGVTARLEGPGRLDVLGVSWPTLWSSP